MTRLTTLEDIGLLPKAIEYAGETFMFNTWVTFKGKLCIGYDTYIDILKVNGREKEIEIIIAETPKIEEAFNKLYQILINGNYKFN